MSHFKAKHFFKVYLTRHSFQSMYVPFDIVRDYGLALEHKEKITFLDPYKRKSIGKVVKWKDKRTCIKGWRSFCNRNKLDQQRDSCICEFLLEKGQKT